MLLTATTFHNTQPSLAATLPTPTSWGPLAFLATMVLLRSQGLGSATALDLATTSSGGGFKNFVQNFLILLLMSFRSPGQRLNFAPWATVVGQDENVQEEEAAKEEMVTQQR